MSVLYLIWSYISTVSNTLVILFLNFSFVIFRLSPSSSVELRWPEVCSLVLDISTVLVLEVVGVDQQLDCLLIVRTEDLELLVRELVDKLVGELPELADDVCDVSGVEPEESASVVLCHLLDKWLDAVPGDLSHTAAFQVPDARPGFNLSWDHGLLDNVSEEEVGHIDESIDIDL